MVGKEYKRVIKDAAKTAYDVFDESDCDGIYDCDKTCPYFGDVDDSGFHCIIVQTSVRLDKIIKISEKR